MSRAASNAPKEHIANVASNLGGVGRKRVGGRAYLTEVTASREGQYSQILDLLRKLANLFSKCKMGTYSKSFHVSVGFDDLFCGIELIENTNRIAIHLRHLPPPQIVFVI